jgi:hypothetical protein
MAATAAWRRATPFVQERGPAVAAMGSSYRTARTGQAAA